MNSGASRLWHLARARRAFRQRDGRGHAAGGAAALCRRNRRALDAVLALQPGACRARGRGEGRASRSAAGLARRRLAHRAGGATLGAAQTLCFWESLKTLETSIAVLLFYTYPAVTLALDRLFFKQPIRPLAVLCIAVILAGAGLITAPGLRGGTIDLRGLAWALPSPLVYALYLAINARLLRRHPPLVGAFGLFAGMAVTFGLAAAFAGLDVPATGWLLLVFIALGPGALTMTLFSYSVPRLGASSFAILANAELVTVVLIGVLVLGEPLPPAARSAER